VQITGGGGVAGKRWWFGLALSPDEKSLLYSVVESVNSNLMLVEKAWLLPGPGDETVPPNEQTGMKVWRTYRNSNTD
jgi:hypothetical protein